MKKILTIKERAGLGITRPFICQADDKNWYVVKTLEMMPLKQMLAEFFGAYLAKGLNLPIPNFELVKFDLTILPFYAIEWKKQISKQTAFASQFIPQAKIAKSQQAKQFEYIEKMYKNGFICLIYG